ncbi:MAG TPA: tRNA (adenosine(37)-N6)-threonylcarbamoyltransferase complex ATPase subunit type 1 TsaE [Acidobacteriaceae bacterium]|nr:tRNA (adenosine(37)-N6)-threonylcarbamoyltransferase complex ATPase subunit type 1 TsaE [Acidobacteriaceae bacterium]
MTGGADARVHEFVTANAEETIRAGRAIAKLLVPPRFLILRGDLGAGKTTLVKGIAEELEAADADEVTSPTFTLIHEYEGMRSGEPVRLYHLDLYRIENERQLDTLGLDDLSGPDSIVLVEWGEKFPTVVSRSNGEIEMTSTGGDTRKVKLTLRDQGSRETGNS